MDYYKQINGEKILMTPAEVEAFLNEHSTPNPTPSLEDRVTETEKNVSNLQAEMDDFGYIFTGKEVSHEDS